MFVKLVPSSCRMHFLAGWYNRPINVLYRVHRVLEKSLKVLEFWEKNSRPLKVLEKSLNLNVPYFEKFCI